MTTFGPFTDQPAPMSEEEANAALDAAIRARVRARRPTDYVIGWAVVTVTEVADDPTINGANIFRPDGQSFVLTAGLLHTASTDWSNGAYNNGNEDEGGDE